MRDFGRVADICHAEAHGDVRRGQRIAAKDQRLFRQAVADAVRTDGDGAVLVLADDGAAAQTDRVDVRHAEIGTHAADGHRYTGFTRKARLNNAQIGGCPAHVDDDGIVQRVIGECNRIIERKERVLVTTLTKKMAEDLTTYLQNAGIRVRYMHSDVAALERMEILRDLRMAKFDVLVGINLLREGLDLPEVSLVAILDADKEGFLRSETSLIQTIGRAARNAGGRVIMYADKITPAMRAAIDETERRRGIQDAYNKAHGIVPKTIVKDVRELIEITQAEGEAQRRDGVKMTAAEREREIAKLEKEMRAAAKQMEYEYAAVLRDRIIELRGQKS